MTPAATSTGAWRRWSAPLREFGLVDGALYIVHRALQALSRGRAGIVAYGLYAQPIGTGAYASVRDDARTQVAVVEPDNAVVDAFPRPRAVIADRYAQGARCHVVCVRGQFAGYIWVSRARHDEDEVRARYVLAEPALSAWDFDVYVEPARRVGRTLGRLWKAVDQHLAGEGVRWSFSRISRFNAASIATHVRLGARPVGSATFVVAGPLQLMVASLRPWVHLSLRSSQQPALTIAPPR